MIPYINEAQYYFGSKIVLENVKKKTKKFGIRYKEKGKLMERIFKLSTCNKILWNKLLLLLLWTYGLQLCSYASKSNIQIIQRVRNRVQRDMVNIQFAKNQEQQLHVM